MQIHTVHRDIMLYTVQNYITNVYVRIYTGDDANTRNRYRKHLALGTNVLGTAPKNKGTVSYGEILTGSRATQTIFPPKPIPRNPRSTEITFFNNVGLCMQ